MTNEKIFKSGMKGATRMTKLTNAEIEKSMHEPFLRNFEKKGMIYFPDGNGGVVPLENAKVVKHFASGIMILQTSDRQKHFCINGEVYPFFDKAYVYACAKKIREILDEFYNAYQTAEDFVDYTDFAQNLFETVDSFSAETRQNDDDDDEAEDKVFESLGKFC